MCFIVEVSSCVLALVMVPVLCYLYTVYRHCSDCCQLCHPVVMLSVTSDVVTIKLLVNLRSPTS